jgi:membrane-bound ClpP family serine protease
MLVVKEQQCKILKKINVFAIVIVILNWIFLSFTFSLAFIGILLLNNVFYLFIINQIKKQKEREEFKKQFGEGNYSKDDINKKHIVNLFESDLDVKSLTRSDIKKQYRIMAKKYHPDVYTGQETDKFASINLSYNFLIDFIK